MSFKLAVSLLSFGLLATNAAAVIAQASTEPEEVKQSISIADFSRAKTVKRAFPRYPLQAQKNGHEGWVVMSFSIDEEGNARAPVVVNSAGHASFERAAEYALSKFKFEPAMLDGKAVESCDNQYKFTFEMSSKRGAHRRFVSKYKKALELLDEKKFAEVKAIIDEMPTSRNFSHYEENWMHLLKSKYFEAMGDTKSEYNSLVDGFKWGKPETTAPDIYLSAWVKILKYRLNSQNYAGAYQAIGRIDKALDGMKEPTDDHQRIKDWIDGLSAKLELAQYWPSKETVGERGFIVEKLVRQKFTLLGDPSQFSSVELRCEAKRFEMDYTKEVAIKVPKRWGECSLFAFGEQGAELEIIQEKITT